MSFSLAHSARWDNIAGKSGVLDSAIGCVFFVALMSLGAYVRIPVFFTPVPITLQTLFVVLSGAMLGKKWGMASQAIYISLGAIGLPVFQGYGYGMGHILGPTGGYLAGFVLASYVVGSLTHSTVLRVNPERNCRKAGVESDRTTFSGNRCCFSPV